MFINTLKSGLGFHPQISFTMVNAFKNLFKLSFLSGSVSKMNPYFFDIASLLITLTKTEGIYNSFDV